MPTEFLHGLYDGGHGAGLKDYWELMMSNPRCAGGFLWDLMDQGVVRTDMGGIVDCMGNFGSDGIVGPHMEKEGSYYTIREVWSPIEMHMTGEVDDVQHYIVVNHYSFTNLKECKFTYKYLQMPLYGQTTVKTLKAGTLPSPDAAPGQQATLTLPSVTEEADVIEVTATDPHGQEVYAWHWGTGRDPMLVPATDGQPGGLKQEETDQTLSVMAQGRTYTFSKQTGRLMQVTVGSKTVAFGNGPRFVAAKRSDRSDDGFYNHDDKEAFKKKTQYTEYRDQGAFAGFTTEDNVLRAHYRHGSLEQVRYTFYGNGSVGLCVDYNFNGVVDLLGICFDYPEQQVKSKSWVGRGPYRVWQNRMEGPLYGFWQTDYNDPIPGETFEYPEFKGYFADVAWMQLQTTEGRIGLYDVDARSCVGVYTPRDGRDHLLYTLPETGISILRVIPAVRNKVNTTDLNGPSAQPYWSKGQNSILVTLRFE